MPALLAAIFAAIGPWITRFFMVKGVLMFAGFLGRVGLVLATNEFFMEPLIDHIISAWNSMPAGMQCWLALFGVTKAAGILVSGLMLITGKRVFFAKA